MLRKRKEVLVEVLEVTKNFDAFPKLEDDYKETSSARGTFSIIVFIVISLLVIFEINYFLKNELKYSYQVDFDYESKLKLNIDITVASPCNSIGADIMDSSSKDILSNQAINMKDTWFELSPQQKRVHDHISQLYQNIRQDYHALHSTLWDSFESLSVSLPEREVFPNYPMNACRIYGTYDLNKIAGNLHIIAGKSLSFLGNHAHMINLINNNPLNFSHRIDDFSFGENSKFVHNALNSDLKIANSYRASFQYFISVVSTEIDSLDIKDTFQYSVTQKEREINHEKESHGTPGIYFKYDISAIKVKVQMKEKYYLELIISLIGIIGGIFATSAMLNSLYQNIKDFLSK